MIRRRGDVPNCGGERARPRRLDESATYVLSGTLRWVEQHGSRAVLAVTEANARGRRLIGETLTLELAATAMRAADRNGDGERTAADLLPGEHVTIKVRLPRRAGAPPLVVAPGRLIADGP